MLKSLKSKYPIFYLLLILCWLGVTYANYVGFSSLRISPSAREWAMAGTGVAAGQGPQAMYSNPALTSQLNTTAINLNYTNWFLDMYKQSLFVVRPFPIINLGLGITNFNAGKLQARPNQPTEFPVGEFTPVDFSFYLNLTRKLDEKVAIGISGRFYYEKILYYIATGYGADLGLLFDVLPNFNFGFSIINFGTTMHFIRDEFWLPTKILTGVNYNFVASANLKTSLTSDVAYLVYDKKIEVNSGLELEIFHQYFIRGGYKFSDEFFHITTGFGVIVKNIRLEYAFGPYQTAIDNTHHFSLSLGY